MFRLVEKDAPCEEEEVDGNAIIDYAMLVERGKENSTGKTLRIYANPNTARGVEGETIIIEKTFFYCFPPPPTPPQNRIGKFTTNMETPSPNRDKSTASLEETSSEWKGFPVITENNYGNTG